MQHKLSKVAILMSVAIAWTVSLAAVRQSAYIQTIMLRLVLECGDSRKRLLASAVLSSQKREHAGIRTTQRDFLWVTGTWHERFLCSCLYYGMEQPAATCAKSSS